MRKFLYKILVTGGAGFIGSEFVRHSVSRGLEVIVLDKLTYAGDLERLKGVKGKYKFYQVDICAKKQINYILAKERPRILVNFAAETHVDRSIKNASAFIKANIEGVHVLLEASLKHKVKKFIQISTDEVYGEIKEGKFTEQSPLKPNSPYAASKAAADLFIGSYIRTHGLPAIIIRPCNNYGPWQYPEKLIPLAVLKILRKEKIPVYAAGKNIREWLYVEDCIKGVLRIIEKGKTGEIYNLGSQQERQNIEVVKFLLHILKKRQDLIAFVKDRPGHDLRYSLDSSKVFKETGWKAKLNFKDGLRVTVEWFVGHRDWLLSKR
ncbi:MAG: dTDP-glucose 4,6-dehydratase [Candidatus Omnitrophica bacterium]|nr:dTDP-glucose 4,6-dehydratase [Candidatus Omnitrophota bacterium]MDD5591936.1 dTDP-glucose 4,6-dehydratase [Candidatus Omnitrophota bacterium]